VLRDRKRYASPIPALLSSDERMPEAAPLPPAPRKRLKGMKIAAERRSEAMPRKFLPVRMKSISEEIHSRVFRILNRMVILLYSAWLFPALSRGKHAPRTPSAAGP
jgi:hypothetical protein